MKVKDLSEGFKKFTLELTFETEREAKVLRDLVGPLRNGMLEELYKAVVIHVNKKEVNPQ